jgi:phospho-N-acetylmuramoyl-pentapeptide-transferase
MNTAILVSILLPAIFTFIIGILIAPIISDFLYKNEMWKKKSVLKSIDGKEAALSMKIHNDESKKTPRMGGLIVWISVVISTIIFYVLSKLFPYSDYLYRSDLISRNQTWLPLVGLVFGGLIGLVDDLLVVNYFKKDGSYIGGGLSLKWRLFFVFLIGLFSAYWFTVKLDMRSIALPFAGDFYIGAIGFGVLVILTTLALFAGGVIDGIDGLSGGVMMSMFTAYGVIAITQQQYDIAKLCFVIVSGILAFLWFNIPPARFYMSETGMISLTLSLSIIIFLVNGVAYLPFIGFVMLATVASVIIQLLSKKFRGKKVFLVAPIHHHFEAIGWPSYKVTMRYWIIAFVTSIFGVLVSLL